MDETTQISRQQIFTTPDGHRFASELEAVLYLKRAKHLERAKVYVEAKGTYKPVAATRLINLIAEFLAFEEMANDMPATTPTLVAVA